ncbi:MAG: non-ribosomal peptide synthetase, partial [Acidobacteria bacterium]|nr:non-ribosomal peptide synthetase [Acidobacteriota bacterium]
GGEAVRLSDAPVYEEYIQWLQRRDLGDTHDWWRTYLAEVEGPTTLVLDKLPNGQERGPQEQSLVLDLEATHRLEAFAKGHHTTVNTLLQLAWGYLLHRHSGERNVVFGAITSGRPAEVPGIEEMIGLFINTIPVKLSFAPGATTATLLSDLHRAFQTAQEHSYLPLHEIQKESALAAGTPLFDSLLVFENYPIEAAMQAGMETRTSALRVTGNGSDEQTNYKLTFIAALAGQLKIRCAYAGDDFSRQTVAGLLQQLALVLTELPSRQAISEIDLLTSADRAQLAAWNAPAADYPRDKSIPALFEEHVARNPHLVALVRGDEQLTYGELDAWANELAHGLRGKGVTNGTLVGLCAERSFEMIAGLLAILKTGGAYVPLDPNYPQARLRMMVEESEAQLVLTQSDLIPGTTGESANATMPSADVDAGDLAYVMFTSGSTGMPKGVMVEHRSVVRLVVNNHYVPLSAESRILQASSVSFDAATFEIWGALLNGGTLVLYPEKHLDLAVLNRELEARTVNTMWLTAGVFEQWSQSLPRYDGIRYVLAGGDVVSPSAVERVYAALPRTTVINGYGPTENTTFTCCHVIPRDADFSRSVPLGRAINGTTVHVLSQELTAVPLGAIGGLYAGGDGVARGYWNRPELTDETFVTVDGARLYRTGDLVRHLSDGTLEFIGRADEQVKIRGFRIELGEIEAQLLRQPDVREAIVLARGEGSAKRLVAYVVGTPDADALAAQLPEYMIPSAFVTLESFPLTANGKIDRRALPEPEWQSTSSYVAPRSATEQQLASIWATLLKLDRVGVDDNFFAIGGDSILSIQAVSRANQAGIHLTTRQLFESPTVAALAALASHGTARALPQEAVTGAMALLPIQQQFLTDDPHARHHFNQSLLLQTPEGFEASFVRSFVQSLLERHDALRLTFAQKADGSWTAEHRELTEAVIEASCIIEQGLDVMERCSQWQQSFDLTNGPLFRAVWFADADRLFLVAHHLIVDGVSWRIVVSDLEQAFAQHRAEQPIALNLKTSSFQRWGSALQTYATSAELLNERDYWLGQRNVSALPVDHQAAAHATYSSSRIERLRLTATETQQLLQQCPPVYRTNINELLLAAVSLGVQRWSGANGVRIALEGHGREDLFDHLDTTQTVGWFTTVFPLMLQSTSRGIATVLKETKEQVRALPNHGLGFGLLRYLVCDAEIVAQADANPPQLVFNYLGQLDSSVARDTVFAPAPESMGPGVDMERLRPYRLGLTGRVSDGVLEFSLDYSEREYRAETMANVARLIQEALREVIAHCLAIGRGDYTPSDFPLAAVSQVRLDAWQQTYPNLARLYPATGMQQGMYFHGLLDRGAYLTQIYPRFAGELSAAHLRKAWELVCNRHDTFRTAFVAAEEKLHQLVVSDVNLPWQEHDWRGMPDAEQRERFEAYRLQDKAAGFDFAQPPLQRITLFRFAEDRWQMLWTHHHMLLDGWCAPIVYKEVMYAYDRLTRGEGVQFGDEPVYENYIQWLQGRDVRGAQAHWREALAALEAPTPLILNKLPKRAGHRGFHEQTLALDADSTQRLEAFARAHNTTVNTLMQLAWGYLLHRYSGEQDVVFGAITSGRPADVRDVEQMVGLFINTIPVKVAFAPNASTSELLNDLHRDFQSSQEHSWLPLTEIQAQSAIGAGVPLFDSLLAFENYPVDTAMATETASRTSNLRIESSATDERTNYKLTLIVTCAGQLKIRCGYMGEVFAEETVARMLGHLSRILTTLPTTARIDDIDILTGDERAELTRWNDTAQDITTDTCLHQMFVQRAVSFPHAVATRDVEGSLTYGEIFRRAIALSRELRARGVEREELVGVRLPKGSGQVIATLGIMMAGAAYLPMEMNWPDERCRAISELASVRFAVAQKTTPTFDNLAAVLDLADFAPAAGDLATLADELSYDGLADKLAYVIFTSGSTGTPKGVAIEHAAAVNTCIDINQRYAIDQNDRVLAVSALSFDLSVYDIFGLLAVGGEVIFPAPHRAVDPRHWAELVERYDITLWDTVPASADLLAQHYELEKKVCPAPIRTIMMSGDWIHPALPKRLWSVFPSASTWSLGGATEASIWSINYAITEDTSDLKSVPYGTPLANQSFHILDRNLRRVPVGVIGELFIGGRGVARCYYGDTERTAKSFIRHEQLGRLYRTGDMGRYLPGGNIEFIGRVDHQVKIRGFRIELGEIEALFTKHEAVDKVIVEVRGSGNDKYLAAYVVPAASVGHPTLIADLKAAARAALPSYMVPAAYVILEAFPLTANGKVDKKALPEPGNQLLADYVAPATDTETALAETWRELLGATREIGTTENFFEAGGNSLLAMQLLYRVEGRLGCRLDIADVFSYQTIALQARFIDAITHDDTVVTDDDADARDEFEELAY